MFAAISLLTLLLQAVLYYFIHGIVGILAASLILSPIVTAVANIQSALDIRHGEIPHSEFMEWALSRLWAVILVDFVAWFASFGGTSLLASASPGEILLGMLSLVLTATLLFADVYVSVEPQPNLLLSIPFAFMRSIGLAWQNGNMMRMLAITAVQIAIFALSDPLYRLLASHHVPGATFAAIVPLGTLLSAPFAVLTTVVYFDAVAREREMTTS